MSYLYREAEKMNLIAIAKQHKQKCRNSTCNVTLCLLRITGERAGLVFTDEEKKVFI